MMTAHDKDELAKVILLKSVKENQSCHQGASEPMEVLSRDFEAFKGQIELPHT